MKRRLILSVMMLTAASLNGALLSGIRNTGANLGRLATGTAARTGGQMPAVLSRASVSGQRTMPGMARRFYSGYAGGAQQGAQFGGRCAALLGGAGAAGLGYAAYENRDRLEEAGLLPQGWRNSTAYAAEYAPAKRTLSSIDDFIYEWSHGRYWSLSASWHNDLRARMQENPLLPQQLVKAATTGHNFVLSLKSKSGNMVLWDALQVDPSVAGLLADAYLRNFKDARSLASADYGTSVFSNVLRTDPAQARRFVDLAYTDLDRIAEEGNGGSVIVPVLEADPSLVSEFAPAVLKMFNATARDLPRTLYWVIDATLKASPSLAPQFADRAIKDFSYVAKQPDGYFIVSRLLDIDPSLAPKFAQELIDDYADIARTWAGRQVIERLEQVDPSLAPKLEEARLKESLRNF